MKEKINEIISRHCSVEASELTEEMSLATSAGITSFEFISSVADIEDEFNIQITDRALESFRTLGDLYRYVEEQIKE